MPREPRIYIENALYLVTAKGDEDRDLFSDSQDFNAYLKSLTEYKKEYGFKLFAFSLLPKSLYLLIELKSGVTISQIMHDLNSRYTKNHNSRYGKKGHLFQSRFKSVLIEKDDYILRISRYIHLLAESPTSYRYSSYALYAPHESGYYAGSEMPEMHDEVEEVLSYFKELDINANRQKAYEAYVQSADRKEVELVSKLLHRKAFVGSKDFIQDVHDRVKNHIIEEVESRTIRKTNRPFAFAGALVILFLGAVAFNFYNNQSSLQKTLNVTASGFQVARKDLIKHVYTLQSEIVEFENRENYGLGGFAWELQLMPVQQEEVGQSFKDHLQFKDGKVISAGLLARGFSPFNYTISQEARGKMVWKTAQTNAEGLTVSWYGIITGDHMRGVLSERPVQGESRDFSFVSMGRVNKPEGVQNAI